MIYIITNNTSGSILIERLGKNIDPAETLTLSDEYDTIKIFQAYDQLESLIQAGMVTINDGTKDLTINEALDQTQLETKFEDSQESNGSGTGFTISTSPPTGSPGIPWFNTEDNIAYQFCGLRNKWLSIKRIIFYFGYPRRGDGVYMDLAGFSSRVNSRLGYKLLKNATICSIVCNSISGNNSKTFDIQDANGNIFSFSYNNSLQYLNENIDIDIDFDSIIRIYIATNGGRVNHTSCQIEIAYRF